MKIIYYSHSDLTTNQANNTHVLKMCSALIKLGHSVELYVWKNKKKSNDDNYMQILNKFEIKNNLKVCHYPQVSPIANSFISSYYLSFKIKFKKIDFIISRNLRFAYFACNNGIPTFYETHKPINLYNFVDRYLFKKMTKMKKFYSLITISSYLINDYNQYPYFKKINKLMLRDSSDINDHLFSQKKNSKPSVGYVGSLYKGRGIEIIIELSRLLKNVDFHIIGDYKKFYSNIKNINSSNLILHGYIDHKDAIKKMSEFDLLLAPYNSKVEVPGGVNTHKWMSPIKLFEYMSVKKPIITSNLAAIKEFMVHDYNCLIVNENDTIEWKNAILKILNDKNLSNKLASNAYNDLILKYTWEIRARKIINEFKQTSQ